MTFPWSWESSCYSGVQFTLFTMKEDFSDKLLRLRDVIKMTSLSRTTIYNNMAKGKFPKNIHLGPKISVWIEREIQEWINSQILLNRK